jgi:hypothetical protein
MAIDIYDAIYREIFDLTFQIDYGKLHQFVCGEEKSIGSAKLWGSPPPHDTFWKMVEAKGFKVTTYKNSYGKEKKVNTSIAYHTAKDIRKIDKSNSEICLVAGDKDFVPVVEDLVSEGFRVAVYFWEHAARELKEAATSFTSLTPWLEHLKFNRL